MYIQEKKTLGKISDNTQRKCPKSKFEEHVKSYEPIGSKNVENVNLNFRNDYKKLRR